METKTQTQTVVKPQTAAKPVAKPAAQTKTTVQTKPAQAKPVATATKPATTTTKTTSVAPKTAVTKKTTVAKTTSQPKLTSTKPQAQTKVAADTKNTVTKKPQSTAKPQTVQKVEKKAQTEEQKTKNAIELIGIFKKLEKNLVDVLQSIPQNVEDEEKESVIADIKSFKNKVDLARKIFDEYENTSNLIAKMIEAEKNDKESIEISKKVMEPTDKNQKSKINEKDLFRQVQSMEKQSNGLDKIEIEAVGDTVVVKKKSVLGREPELRKN